MTSFSSKTSFPAGTGVWVVKTDERRIDSSASSVSTPRSTSARRRSSCGKAEWPSFRWKTFGSIPSAASAHAADAEQQLLADPVLAVAAVERVREPVDLEQVEGDDARVRGDVLAPHRRLDLLPVELDGDGNVLLHEPDGRGVDALVVLGLAADSSTPWRK